MSGTELKQRLAAILAADVTGYSRLMGADERATVAALDAARLVFRTQIESSQGRVIDMAGDSVLAVFETTTGAVSAALAVQQNLEDASSAVPEDRRMRFRIGVHLGDVIEKSDGTVYGDGVNIAARLEGMADPGGVLISQSVRDSVVDRLDFVFFDNGERKFKNIARPIRVWSWPRQLSAARAESKPRVFVADFEGRDEEEARFAADLGDELRAHLARLTGLEIAGDRREAHYVVEGRVRWQSLTPTKLAVDSLGALRALAPGIGVVRASVHGATAERELQLVNPPAATIVPNFDSLTLVLPGSSAQLSATPFDSAGIAIVGAPLVWESSASRIAVGVPIVFTAHFTALRASPANRHPVCTLPKEPAFIEVILEHEQ